MRKTIDQLLMDGKEDEAIPLIEKIWEKERQSESKMISDLARKIEDLEKRFRIKQ